MNSHKSIIMILIIIISLAGCCTEGFKRIKTPEGELAIPNCCPMIKYHGTTISVKGLDLAIPDLPVKIGEVTVEPKTIQQASDIVQILEQHRMSTCRLLPSCATISKAKFVESLEQMQKDEAILTQFALVVASKDGKAIQEFVRLYGPQARYLCSSEISTAKIKNPRIWPYSLAEFEPSKSVTVLPFKELFHP
jgi:uncharacterized lipoprotein YajG